MRHDEIKTEADGEEYWRFMIGELRSMSLRILLEAVVAAREPYEWGDIANVAEELAALQMQRVFEKKGGRTGWHQVAVPVVRRELGEGE
jgi:hypothetical protein